MEEKETTEIAPAALALALLAIVAWPICYGFEQSLYVPAALNAVAAISLQGSKKKVAIVRLSLISTLLGVVFSSVIYFTERNFDPVVLFFWSGLSSFFMVLYLGSFNNTGHEGKRSYTNYWALAFFVAGLCVLLQPFAYLGEVFLAAILFGIGTVIFAYGAIRGVVGELSSKAEGTTPS